FHDAERCFSALGRNRNRHSPAQILEIFPVIHLRLINNKSVPVAELFAWPARVTALAGSRCRYFKWRNKNRRCDDRALKQRSVKKFHKDPEEFNHATPTVQS